MQNYAKIGTFGILALIALRVTIGWHFYMEGVSKIRGNDFSSEGFLVAAQGPLKDKFQQLIWDNDGRLRLDQPKVNGLFEQASEQAVDHFGFTDEQQKKLADLNKQYFGLDSKGKSWVGKLNDVYAAAEEDIYKYWESADRLASMDQSDTWRSVASLRGQKEKIENDRMADVRSTMAAVDAIWNQYETDLNAIAEKEQIAEAGKFRFARPNEAILNSRVVDKIIPIFDMSVGILLMIGLLTPLASWAGAIFLISVILTQMPGFPGTQPTYYQAIECIALIVLATMDAGRYAGLDFFPWSWWQNKRAAAAA